MITTAGDSGMKRKRFYMKEDTLYEPTLMIITQKLIFRFKHEDRILQSNTFFANDTSFIKLLTIKAFHFLLNFFLIINYLKIFYIDQN